MAILGNSDLYNRIDQLLNKKNMSRRQLAKIIGVPPTTLQSAFEKNSNLSINRLSKIAKALDVEPGDILGSSWGMTIALDTLDQCMNADYIETESIDPKTGDWIKKKEPTPLKQKLDEAFSQLNADGKRVAVERVKELAQLPQYQKKNPAGDSTQSAGAGDEKAPE